MIPIRWVWLGFSLVWISAGCAPLLVGAGAAGTAGAYEAHNKHELDELDKQKSEGTISDQDYGTRKDAIKDQSLIY